MARTQHTRAHQLLLSQEELILVQTQTLDGAAGSGGELGSPTRQWHFGSSEVPEAQGTMLPSLGCVKLCGEQVKGFPPTCASGIPELVLVKHLEMPGQDRNWGTGEGCGCKKAAQGDPAAGNGIPAWGQRVAEFPPAPL